MCFQELQNENSNNTDDSDDDLPVPRDRRFTQSMEWPPRKQSRTVETVEVGCLNIISAKYEVSFFFFHFELITQIAFTDECLFTELRLRHSRQHSSC